MPSAHARCCGPAPGCGDAIEFVICRRAACSWAPDRRRAARWQTARNLAPRDEQGWLLYRRALHCEQPDQHTLWPDFATGPDKIREGVAPGARARDGFSSSAAAARGSSAARPRRRWRRRAATRSARAGPVRGRGLLGLGEAALEQQRDRGLDADLLPVAPGGGSRGPARALRRLRRRAWTIRLRSSPSPEAGLGPHPARPAARATLGHAARTVCFVHPAGVPEVPPAAPTLEPSVPGRRRAEVGPGIWNESGPRRHQAPGAARWAVAGRGNQFDALSESEPLEGASLVSLLLAGWGGALVHVCA